MSTQSIQQAVKKQDIQKYSSEELAAAKSLALMGEEAITKVEGNAYESDDVVLRTRAKLARTILEMNKLGLTIFTFREREDTKSLKKMRSEFEIIFDSEPTPLVVINGERHILMANKAARNNGEVSKESVVGIRPGNLLGCVHSMDSPEGCGFGPECGDCDGRKLVQKTIDSNMPSGNTLTKIKLGSEGDERSIIMSATPLFKEEEEEERKYIISMQDITDQLQKDRQFLQVQKMEAIARLAGGIAHDLNNVNAAVLGNIDLLARCYPGNSEAEEMISDSKTAIKRGSELIQQILTFSSPEKEIEKTFVDVNSIIDEVYKLISRTAGEDIVFDFDLGPGLSKINANAGKINQVIMNLAINAIDAMPNGGVLEITSSKVERSNDLPAMVAKNKENYVQITVKDSGTGMRPADIDHIFEPFFTTKGMGKGTGLGLSVTHGIIENHNGFIKVKSEKGQGTEFCVYLPTHEDKMPKIKKALKTDEWPVGKGERILLVDDNEHLAKLAPRIIGNNGYELTVAVSPYEAIELFKKNGEFDMLITDVGMPGMNGPELANKLKEENKDLKVLLMSGYLQESLKSIDGVTDYDFIRKPFEGGEILRKLRKVLEDSK